MTINHVRGAQAVAPAGDRQMINAIIGSLLGGRSTCSICSSCSTSPRFSARYTFFASSNATLLLAALYAACAVTLLLRPVGSALFGHYADVYGRQGAKALNPPLPCHRKSVVVESAWRFRWQSRDPQIIKYPSGGSSPHVHVQENGLLVWRGLRPAKVITISASPHNLAPVTPPRSFRTDCAFCRRPALAFRRPSSTSRPPRRCPRRRAGDWVSAVSSAPAFGRPP